MSLYSVQRAPTRNRVPALQATDHACVAASIADALADLLRVPSEVQVQQLQQKLIKKLGGLENSGTTFPAAARAVAALFPREVQVQVTRAHLDQAVAWAAMGAGVVVRLSNGPGLEGHAVRIEGGEGALRQTTGDPVMDAYLHGNTEMISDTFETFVFDPWPGSANLRVESIGQLRARFDAGGRDVLLLTRAVDLRRIAGDVLQNYANIVPPNWHVRGRAICEVRSAEGRLLVTCTTTGASVTCSASDDPADIARRLFAAARRR